MSRNYRDRTLERVRNPGGLARVVARTKPTSRTNQQRLPTNRRSRVAEELAEKRVSWAELFFDLVFVFAVTQVSALLHADHSWAGVGRALIVLAPMYWAWVGVTVFTNTRGTDSPRDRIGILMIGLGSLFMAMAVPEAFDDRGLLFGCSYLGLRIVTGWLVLWGRPLFLNPVSVSLILTGPLLVVGG